MLYLFLVGSGTHVNLDMSLACGDVAGLQRAIANICEIPEDQQVLLVSGGTVLTRDSKVFEYSAGTDTNPIFVCTRSGGDSGGGSFYEEYCNTYPSIEERVIACSNMSVDYQALTARCQLAQELSLLGNQELASCTQLVEAQHMQHLGWSAVLANLEDEVKSMCKIYEVLKNSTQQYFKSRPMYLNLLYNFREAFNRLDRVPLLPIFVSECDQPVAKPTLKTKFATESMWGLKEVADNCRIWIERFDECKLTSMKCQMDSLIKECREGENREVKGIEEWLFKLNEKMVDAKKYSLEQHRFAKSLLSHQNRLSNMSEPSILQDLCKTHHAELNAMLRTHYLLTQLHEQCRKAKQELSLSLQKRIQWVASLEGMIFRLKNEMALHDLNLERLVMQVDLIEQMYMAPQVYVKTLVEIRRRKVFSSHFLKWASAVSEQASCLHNKEVEARTRFRSEKATNFIDCLFPGMDDNPPPFATVCPDVFDAILPDINQEDLEKLKVELPEFAFLIDVPPSDTMPLISHKSNASDSAFGSEVPSLQVLVGPSQLSVSCQSSHLLRTATLSSSSGSTHPEYFSPVPCCFDDLSDADNQGKRKLEKSKSLDEGMADCRRVHGMDGIIEKELFSPIAEEQNNVESDVDEFERVDSLPKCAYDPFDGAITVDMVHKLDSGSDKISKSSSGAVAGAKVDAKTSAEGTLPSLGEERLRSPDSMVTSHGFHSADYFFDDSMPSSYTESTGMSALGKGQHMVKTHHVIVAELQNQLTNTNLTLAEVEGSLPVSRSADLMKLHATMSALQKFVRAYRERTSLELESLRKSVLTQRQALAVEVGSIMTNVEVVVDKMRMEMESEKSKALDENVMAEKAKNVEVVQGMQQLLEVEMQKFRDAGREVQIYQEQIYVLKEAMEETNLECSYKLQKMEKDHRIQFEALKRDLETKQTMELQSLREETELKIMEKDNEIARLIEELKEKQTQIHMLGIEKENLDVEHQENLSREREKWAEMIERAELDVSTQYSEDVVKCDQFTEMEAQATPSQVIQNVPELLEEDNALRHAMNNEKLYLQLSTELLRIWDVLYCDFDGRLSDKFPIQFIEKITNHVENLVQRFASQMGAQCEAQIKTQEESLKIRSMEMLEELKAKRLTFSMEKVDSETAERQKEFCQFIDQCIDLFNDWAVTTAYNSYSNANLDGDDSVKVGKVEMLENQLKIDHIKHAEEIEKLKSLHVAENQVSFNEAINKVAQEKDDVISGLMNNLVAFEKSQEMIKTVITNCIEQCPDTSHGDQETSSCSESKQLLYKTLLEIEEIIKPHAVSAERLGSSDSLMLKVKDLEKELKKERGKLTKIFEKVSKASHLKLSLLTCDPGDCVMFCYNDKCKNYVAFHFGTTPHFLHLDSVKALQLKIPPDSPKTTWAIGIIIDKEYYLAKKKPNRYNVKSGCLFYCVKVKPWEKGNEMRQRCMGQPGITVKEVTRFQSVSSPDSPMDEASSSKSDQMSASAI